MFNMAEQAQREVVGSGRVSTVSEVETGGLVRKSVVDRITQAVLSDTGFIVPTAETVGKMVYRALDE